jgi:hypothetical protein
MGIQASVCSYCNQDKEINKKKRCILHTGVVLQIRFLMKGEKIFLKKIFLLSVYKVNRAVFPFCRKIW